MMGLETLLEAAKYLEYRAEVEARGEKGLPDLPTNCSAAILSTNQNGLNNHGSSKGLHFLSQAHQFKNHLTNNSGGLSRVPEPLNGLKIPDHSYRRLNHDDLHHSHSPTFDFNGGTNRIINNKNNNLAILNNRNSGTREVHNKLEKNRRAHLKECFEMLKSQLPTFEDRKISNLAILRGSLRHIQSLKRKEREHEQELERLAREKISLQQRLSALKKDLLGKCDHLDWRSIVPEEFDVDLDLEGSNTASGSGLTSSISPDTSVGSHEESPDSEPKSPSEINPKSEFDESNDSLNLGSLNVNNCHLGEKITVKKLFGQINGVSLNGGSNGSGPISLVTTTKLSSSPLAAITVEKTANSPIGGASYVNNMGNDSGKGFSVLNNLTLAVTSKIDVGQYYEDEKMCK